MKKKLRVFISLSVVAILSMCLIYLPEVVAANISSIWTTKGDFKNNASTTGTLTTRSLVDISGVNQQDDADISLSRKIDFIKPTIAGGYYHSVGINNDGSVLATGDNSFNELNVGNWNNIVSVAAGYYHTVGLKSNGTVVAVGNNAYGQLNVGSWNNIKSIASSYYQTIGLKNDGTVVATGQDNNLKLNVENWTNIKAIAAGVNHTVGLKNDGTVVAVGDNSYGQRNVGSWTNIKAIAAGAFHTIGLKKDGTVVAVGDIDSGVLAVSNWSNIRAIAAGYYHTVGLKNDSTVVAAGDNTYGQLNLGDWQDIISISAGGYHTLGLKNDHTVLAKGRNNKGQLNVSAWNIKDQFLNTFELSGFISGLKINTGQLPGVWSNIFWQATTPANTAIKFRTRGADVEANLSSAPWSPYYTVSGSTITTPPSRWLEVEAFLKTTDGVSTPIIKSISINYTKNNNLLKNSSFEIDDNSNNLPDNWWFYNTEQGDGMSTGYFKEGNYSLKINGKTSRAKYVRQRIQVSGNAGDKYTLSGWNKTIGASISGCFVGAFVYVNNNDNTKNRNYLVFYKNTHDWTKGSINFTANKNYSSVDIYLVYLKQTGVAYFDDFNLVKQ